MPPGQSCARRRLAGPCCRQSRLLLPLPLPLLPVLPLPLLPVLPLPLLPLPLLPALPLPLLPLLPLQRYGATAWHWSRPRAAPARPRRA